MKLSVYYPNKPVQLDGHGALHSLIVGNAGVVEIHAQGGSVFVKRNPLPHLVFAGGGMGRTDEVPSWVKGPGRPAVKAKMREGA